MLIKLILNTRKPDASLFRGLHTFLNPYSYLLARKSYTDFSQFDQIHVDGIALVIFLKIFGVSGIMRTSFDMTSLAPLVFEDATLASKSIYFLGAEEGVIDLALSNIKGLYPQLNVVGFRKGYFSGDVDKETSLKSIMKLSPDIIVCGMGTPLQEKTLLDLRKMGWKGTGYTCGGFLHQIAKRVDYYPVWIDMHNLRWAYRIYDEPKLLKRYLWEYLKFIFLFTFDYIKLKKTIL